MRARSFLFNPARVAITEGGSVRNYYRFAVDGACFATDFCATRTPVLGPNHGEYGGKRLLFELLNDGRRLFMRTFEDGTPTCIFRWQKFSSFRPLTITGSHPHKCINAVSGEVITLCYDVHVENRGNTALVLFRYHIPGKRKVERYLAIREWTTVSGVIYPEKNNNRLVLWSNEYF